MAATDTPRPNVSSALRLPVSLLLIGFSTLGVGSPGPAALAQEPVPGGSMPGMGPVTADERQEVVARIVTLLEERYVFPEIGIESGRKLRAELDRGAFDAMTDPKEFATALTTTLQGVNHDKHMRVVVKQAQAVREDLGDPIAQHMRQRQQAEEANFGFNRIERMDGNIGYLDLRGFAPAGVARETAVAAMRMLAGADAIVIDLRKNGGGSPDMVQLLCSYFFDTPTHLNSLYWREGDRTQEFWTMADVPGPRLVDVPVFVVTSGRTFSGAEEFCYNMQTRKRATLVGEVTGGGANPGGVFAANERFGIFVPTGRAINPITKTNWEGTGVTPDISVAAENALDSALALARVAAEEYRRGEVDASRVAREALARELTRAEELFASGQGEEGTRVVASALESARAKGLVEEGIINWLGYDYLGRKALPMAIAVLEYNAKAYPASGNVHDSLGEALLASGDRSRGLASYRRSLELDPRNTNAKAIIEKLESEQH